MRRIFAVGRSAARYSSSRQRTRRDAMVRLRHSQPAPPPSGNSAPVRSQQGTRRNDPARARAHAAAFLPRAPSRIDALGRLAGLTRPQVAQLSDPFARAFENADAAELAGQTQRALAAYRRCCRMPASPIVACCCWRDPSQRSLAVGRWPRQNARSRWRRAR